MKSVSQTLHTVTPTVIRPLLRYYFSTAANSEALEDAFTVIRRTMTALIHHCKTADQYTPITDILLEQLSLVTSLKITEAETDMDHTGRVLNVLTVLCSVRSGSRISAKNLSTILTHLQSIPITDELHVAYLKLTVACLTAGDMALWMGAGRKVFERTWAERPKLALQITGATLELGWGGWQMIALPHVVKRSLDVLESNTEVVCVLEVLSAAQKEGKLSGVDEKWKERLRKWAIARFSKWDGSEEQVCRFTSHGYEQRLTSPGIRATIRLGPSSCNTRARSVTRRYPQAGMRSRRSTPWHGVDTWCMHVWSRSATFFGMAGES